MFANRNILTWHKDGWCHRKHGPAVENLNGGKGWYQNWKRHREDGPAVEDVDGYKYWFINDIWYSKTEFNKVIRSCKI